MTVPIQGTVAPGFEEVRTAFEENFATRGEIGAAASVYFRGEPVVDLWGGVRDIATGALWERDTIVMVYSTTKGMTAMCYAVAHSRGWFDWDDPVADHWPEFAQENKSRITVRDLLSHRAALVALDAPVDASIIADHDALAAILARQRPHWEPGTRTAYHAITFGFYSNALLRRIDPKRRSLGRFFQEEIAERLGVTFHIGLPESLDARMAQVVDFRVHHALLRPRDVPWRLAVDLLLRPQSLPARSLRNPRVSRPSEFTGPVLRRVELPSTNAIGEPRAVARVYGDVASGGDALGLARETVDLLQRMPEWRHETADPVTLDASCFWLGFSKPQPTFDFGGDECFGAPGLGGSFGFADPTLELGYCYAPNRLGMYPRNDPREIAVRDAARRCAMRQILF